MNRILRKLPLWSYFCLCLAGIIIVLFLLPPEQTLGNGIRLIYLHAAWVWTGILLYTLSAGTAFIAILSHKIQHHHWSAALGRAGLFFWLTYLPMSLWVMKLNWNGFFFAEPRWSIPFSLAVASLLMQVGVWVIHQPVLTSIANLGFGSILIYNMSKLQSVLHPDSAIQSSGSIRIQVLFILLLGITLITGLLFSNYIRLWTARFRQRNAR